MMSEILRSCVICKKKDVKKNLIRFVWEDGRPVADDRQIRAGRGAYCCPDGMCKEKFLSQKKRWRRVFRK